MTATIAVHEFISADGVFESPSWTFEFGFDPKMGETLGAITESLEHHPARPPYPRDVRARLARPHGRGRPGSADFFNQTEKFVVGANEPAEEWNNTTRLGAYDADAIRRLKEERDGVIYISGSGQLVRGLLAEGWSTTCTCSSTRSRSARASASGPTASSTSSRSRRTTSTTTAWCT